MDIVRRIPWELTSRTTGGANYQLSSDAFDVALSGMPFLLATSDQRPYSREIEDSRKQMFDNFAEPGEYSLTDWWLRSQQDWGGGQGVLYQDPDVDNRFNFKFKQSTGINPWTPGQIQLLPAPIPITNTIGSSSALAVTRAYRRSTNGRDAAWVISAGSMKTYEPGFATEISVNYHNSTGDTQVQSFTSMGETYYVATKTAIWTGTDVGTGSQLWTYADPSPGETGAVFVEVAKGRLMMGYANKVYELVPPGGAPPHALPATPVFTHLNPKWRWRSMCDGPNSIYMAGNDGTSSAIYKLQLDTTGAVPTLTSGGTITATFPPGEIVNALYSYLGTFVGISTNMGFRIGEIDSNGDINYGPLLWNKPSYEIGGYDRFFYVRVDDGIILDPDQQDDRTPGPTQVLTGLYRVDLGQRLEEQTTSSVRFAYSTDVYAQHVIDDVVDFNSQLRAFTILSNKFIFGITGESGGTITDLYIDYWPTEFEMNRTGGPDYDLVSSGWIQTGRVRYNTLEPKLFRYFSVRSPAPLMGNIDVDVIDEEGNPTRYVTYTAAMPPDVGDIPLSGIDQSRTYLSLRFTLHRNATDNTDGAVMSGWQIKSVPAPIRQRIFTFTVLCFDHEQDKTGQGMGYEGYALERIESMELIAQRGYAILLQDLQNERVSQVVIQSMQFVQSAPPGPTLSGWGGYLTFKLKTVSDVI